MLKVIMTEDKLDRLMEFYLNEIHYGRMKYLWEIAVPDKEEISFCCWLDKCEALGLSFSFAVIDRYKDYKLMYGFSDFEIPERKGIKCLQISFDNDDILYQHFMKWREESEYFMLPVLVRLNLEINSTLSGKREKFELYDDGTLEQKTGVDSVNFM